MRQNTKTPLMILYFGMFMTQCANMVCPMMTMLLQDKLNMTATQISYALVLNFAALAISAFAGGKLADAFNKKHVILLFDALSVGLYLAGGLMPFSYLTVALIILAGSFQQLEIASYSMLVSELSPEDERDKAFSKLYMAINVGAFFSTALSGFLILTHTSLVFILNATGVLASTVILGLFLSYTRKTPEQKSETEEKKPATRAIAAFRLCPVLIIYLVMTAVAEAVHSEYSYIVPLEITRVFKDGGSTIYGTMLSASCLVIILTTTLIANLTHKYTHTVKMFLSNLSQGMGYFVLFIGFTTRQIPLLYIGFLIYIFGEIFDSLYYEAYMVSKVPDECCGQVYGLFSTVLKITVMGADVLTGILYDNNPELAWGMIFALVLITIVLTSAIHVIEGGKIKVTEQSND